MKPVSPLVAATHRSGGLLEDKKRNTFSQSLIELPVLCRFKALISSNTVCSAEKQISDCVFRSSVVFIGPGS